VDDHGGNLQDCQGEIMVSLIRAFGDCTPSWSAHNCPTPR
jgi:hypothetical protein